MTPDFAGVRAVEIRNIRTGERAELVRADAVEVTPEMEAEVTGICNEPLVYDLLFRRTLKGAPYPPESARRFLEEAAKGWRERTHFIFLILRADGSLVGNVDLRGTEGEAAEIGYWATARAPGFMTPAVGAVCEIARQDGYESLYAFTRTYNERSMAVLRRNGFEDVGLVGTGEELARKFVKALRPRGL